MNTSKDISMYFREAHMDLEEMYLERSAEIWRKYHDRVKSLEGDKTKAYNTATEALKKNGYQQEAVAATEAWISLLWSEYQKLIDESGSKRNAELDTLNQYYIKCLAKLSAEQNAAIEALRQNT